MKLSPLFISLVTCHLSLVTLASAATPAACPPYTFVGRITDAAHVAFDATNAATLRAYAADSTPLASEKTFFRDDTARNYALQIPMASSPATGCVVTGDVVLVTATDPYGKVWSGVIHPAVIGTPGTVSVVDIVLAEDANGDGIDDALFAELQASWEDSDAFDPAVAYNPALADSDGDGVSDLDEALLGTNPFDVGDCLAIQSFSASPLSLSFESAGGHVYAVEASSSLVPGDADWAPVPIATDPSDKSSSRTLYAIPSSARAATTTLYLFPTSSPAFFRLAPQ